MTDERKRIQKELRTKPISELIALLERSPCTEMAENKPMKNFWGSLAPIENEYEKTILDRISELTPDEFIRFQFVKRGRLYKNDYFISKSEKPKIEQTFGTTIKESFNDSFTGINSEKTKAVDVIFCLINKDIHDALFDKKDGEDYINFFHYSDNGYWDVNDSQFQLGNTIQYFETQYKQSGEKESILISSPEEYENAKSRNVQIEKRQYKTKLHTFIAEIITSYESDGKDIFDNFEELKEFIAKRINQYTRSTKTAFSKTKLTHRDVIDTSKNHNLSMGISRVSREMTKKENQDFLFGCGVSIEIGNSKKECDMKVWLEEGAPQLPSYFVDCIYEKKLCTFDNALSDVLGSFVNSQTFVAGKSFVSEDDILSKMSGGDKRAFRNTELADRVKQSIKRMDATRAKVDYSALEAIHAFKGKGRNLELLRSCSVFERVLNISPAIIRSKNGKEIRGFFFHQIPLLYRVSEALNQQITIDEKYFNVDGVRNTPDTFLIIRYLIIEITRSNSRQEALFESIIKNSGVEEFGIEILQDRKKKYDFKKKLEKMFEQWKKVDLISSYELQNDKVFWTKAKLIEEPKYPIKRSPKKV